MGYYRVAASTFAGLLVALLIYVCRPSISCLLFPARFAWNGRAHVWVSHSSLKSVTRHDI